MNVWRSGRKTSRCEMETNRDEHRTFNIQHSTSNLTCWQRRSVFEVQDRRPVVRSAVELAIVGGVRGVVKSNMKKLFKWLFRLIPVLVLVVLVLLLLLDTIAKSLVERQIRELTGLEPKIGRVSIGLRSPTLAVENFKLFNSPDFGNSTFIDIPELHVEYDLPALRSRKIHLTLVRFNLGELHIVQNKNGRTNLQALQQRQKQKPSASASATSKAGTATST